MYIKIIFIVLICHHRTQEAWFVWVGMHIRVLTRVNTKSVRG